MSSVEQANQKLALWVWVSPGVPKLASAMTLPVQVMQFISTPPGWLGPVLEAHFQSLVVTGGVRLSSDASCKQHQLDTSRCCLRKVGVSNNGPMLPR